MTYSTFKSICKRGGLIRKNNVTNRELKNIIRNELNTSLSLVGYSQMTEYITLKYNIWVSKENLRKAMKEIYPEEVDKRRRKVIHQKLYDFLCPADIHHLDGNNKCKRGGLCKHGYVDGFSSKLLWLVTSSTNNDPLVIGNFFCSA